MHADWEGGGAGHARQKLIVVEALQRVPLVRADPPLAPRFLDEREAALAVVAHDGRREGHIQPLEPTHGADVAKPRETVVTH